MGKSENNHGFNFSDSALDELSKWTQMLERSLDESLRENTPGTEGALFALTEKWATPVKRINLVLSYALNHQSRFESTELVSATKKILGNSDSPKTNVACGFKSMRPLPDNYNKWLLNVSDEFKKASPSERIKNCSAFAEAVILTATDFVIYENDEHAFDEFLPEMPEYRELVKSTKNRVVTQFSNQTWAELEKEEFREFRIPHAKGRVLSILEKCASENRQIPEKVVAYKVSRSDVRYVDLKVEEKIVAYLEKLPGKFKFDNLIQQLVLDYLRSQS